MCNYQHVGCTAASCTKMHPSEDRICNQATTPNTCAFSCVGTGSSEECRERGESLTHCFPDGNGGGFCGTAPVATSVDASNVPSKGPSDVPSKRPSDIPSKEPSVVLSDAPSVPSDTPSNVPSKGPSDVPSKRPSDVPSKEPRSGFRISNP